MVMVATVSEKLRELDQQSSDPQSVWQGMYDYIESLEQQEIEKIGQQFVGRFVSVQENVNWIQNPAIKQEYITKIIEDVFYEVFDIEYEEYVKDKQKNSQVEQPKVENIAVENATKESATVHTIWSQKTRVELEILTNQQLYNAILEVDNDPAQIDHDLYEQFVKTYKVSSIEQAVEEVDKAVLIEELERLVSPLKPEVVHDDVAVSAFALNEWQDWYNIYGKAAYNEANTTHKLEAPNKITLYEGLNLEIDDQYQLKIPANLELHDQQVLICNGVEGETFVGVAKLENRKRTEDGPVLSIITWQQQQIALDIQQLKNERYSLLVVEKAHGTALQQAIEGQKKFDQTFYRIPFNLNFEPLQSVTTPLCIDFGTTNTTLGCYLQKDYVENMPTHSLALGNIQYEGYTTEDETFDGVNFIHFYNMPTENKDSLASRKSVTIPTVVYVEAIDHATGYITYKYGYEALQAVREIKDKQVKYGDIDERRSGSLIYGLKRWIYTLDVQEELVDQYGNKQLVARQDILKGYIDYILSRAMHQVKAKFTTLHFSTPIKMKAQFIHAFAEMLPDYKVVPAEEALDEGVAVLYDAIRQEVDKNEDGFKGRAWILDCGGGTTDLANCEYTLERDFLGDSSLKIQTKFENGNPNFGGNNLTYRIMQMLKIKLAVLYRGAQTSDFSEIKEYATVEKYLKAKEAAIDAINEAQTDADDTSAVVKLYEALEQAYKQEEKFIPTAYKRYEHLSSQYVEKVRHNFHFLWDLAENMKREFFSQLNKVTIDLNKDLRTHVGAFTLYTLQADEQLQLMKSYPQQFSFTIREIEQLIVPEIYGVEHQFLNGFAVSDFIENDVKTIIKLTGQSCRIPYFRDMLKEFIPGKYIKQSKNGIDSEKQALELKLACVRGVIHYWRDHSKGFISKTNGQANSKVPYDVIIERPARVVNSALDPADTEFLIEKGHEIGQNVGVAAIQSSADHVMLIIKNARKRIGEVRKITLQRTAEYFDTTRLSEELAGRGFADSGYLDILNDTRYRKHTLLFANTEKEAWGVTIRIVTFDQEQQQWRVVSHYEPFEDANAYENFFDGNH